MMYCSVIGGRYGASSVVFDGTNDYLTRTTDLTGNADSKKMIFSTWYKSASSLFPSSYFYSSGSPDAKNYIQLSGGRLYAEFFNSSGATVIRLAATTQISDTDWHHYAFSFDVGAGIAKILIDGVEDTPYLNVQTNDTIDFTKDRHVIGASYTGGYIDYISASVAETYINFGEYLDISTAGNIGKLIRNDRPSFLGADGSALTGTAPIIYLNGATSAFPTNKGTGGNFTLAGTLTAGTAPVVGS